MIIYSASNTSAEAGKKCVMCVGVASEGEGEEGETRLTEGGVQLKSPGLKA